MRQRRNKVAVGGLARVSDSVSQHSVKLALAEFLGCLPTVFRDTFLAAGWAQAANNAGLRFETALSWVLLLAACDHASGPNDLAAADRITATPETARDLPGALSYGPEFFEQRYVFRIPTHGRYYTPTDSYRLF